MNFEKVPENQLPRYSSVDCRPNCYNYPVKPYKILQTCTTSPLDRNLWWNTTQQTPNPTDQVRANIVNGLWLCNFEPYQAENYKLCMRNFFTEPQADVPPFQRTEQVDNESHWIRPQMSNDITYCLKTRKLTGAQRNMPMNQYCNVTKNI
jgi:hypothetical protein